MKELALSNGIELDIGVDTFGSYIVKIDNVSFTVQNYNQFKRELINITKVREVTGL